MIGKKDKRGITPVIATVLLIGVVIVMAVIVFIWLRSLTKESSEKFGQNTQLVCSDVRFSADYSSFDGVISISNDGNVPIRNFLIKEKGFGDTSSFKTAIDGVPVGQARDIDVSGKDFSTYETLTVIPVLLANSKSGNVEFICDDQYGVEINLNAWDEK
mgnify:CR=1 FL=1